jgi:hypothetical protein
MISKKSPDENLLNAQLDFIMNAPMEDLDAYMKEANIDRTEIDRNASQAFERAIENHAKAAAGEALASLTPAQQRQVAENLSIRRSVLTGFREHRVHVASTPKRFLMRFAAEISQPLEALAAALSDPAPRRLAVQHKSDAKPLASPARVSFEQLLHEAGMSSEEIEKLTRDND